MNRSKTESNCCYCRCWKRALPPLPGEPSANSRTSMATKTDSAGTAAAVAWVASVAWAATRASERLRLFVCFEKLSGNLEWQHAG